MTGLEFWLTFFSGLATGASWMCIRERARTDPIIEQLEDEKAELIRQRFDELGVPRDDR